MLSLTELTERLARLVAAKTGTTPEAVIHDAVEDRARAAGVALDAQGPRDLSPEAIAYRKTRMRRFADELTAMPLIDKRSPTEIMGELNAL